MGIPGLVQTFILLCGISFGIFETEATEDPCRKGYSLVSDASLCIKVYGSSKTWDGARNKCQKKNSDLLTIHDVDTFNAIKDSGLLPHSQNFWIGLNDKAVEGNYVWLDETTRAAFHNLNMHPTYTRHSASHDCILLMTSGSYQWYMQACDSQKAFICSYTVSV